MSRSTARGRVNKVRRHRRALDLTQAELAEAVGVSRQTVISIEAGDYAPSVYLALALATHLDSTVEELFAEGGQGQSGEASGHRKDTRGAVR